MNLRYDFTGKSVIVTGAARGIGLSVARLFVSAGANLTAMDWDSEKLAEAWGEHAKVLQVACDVSSVPNVNAAVELVVREFGQIDVVVNNAGITRDRVVWKMTEQEWDEVIAVHLKGTFNMTKAVIPFMRSLGQGRIINVTSYSGLHGNFGQANYAAAKAGMIGFTKAVAKEVAPFGITVNAISPNATTDMVAAIPPEALQALIASIPIGRFGDPTEMAPTFGFLASDEAAYITGTVLAVDGGLSM